MGRAQGVQEEPNPSNLKTAPRASDRCTAQQHTVSVTPNVSANATAHSGPIAVHRLSLSYDTNVFMAFDVPVMVHCAARIFVLLHDALIKKNSITELNGLNRLLELLR